MNFRENSCARRPSIASPDLIGDEFAKLADRIESKPRCRELLSMLDSLLSPLDAVPLPTAAN